NPPPGVRYLGAVSDRVLATLYRRALVFCSPSAYEGFGLSLLEAMRSACVVIAARNSAVPELVGDGGILIDEVTLGGLRARLAQVNSGAVPLAELRAQALQRDATYTWEETARRTLAVYQEATNRPAPTTVLQGATPSSSGFRVVSRDAGNHTRNVEPCP